MKINILDNIQSRTVMSGDIIELMTGEIVTIAYATGYNRYIVFSLTEMHVKGSRKTIEGIRSWFAEIGVRKLLRYEEIESMEINVRKN